MAQWVGVQGQLKVAKKKPKHRHLQRSPQRTPNRNRKAFFFDLLNPGMVWIAIAWRVVAKRVRDNILAFAVVKGLKGNIPVQKFSML